jgi:hypothetical protein
MSEHDDKGCSEEKCLRCGWVMGSAPLNCNNDNTPHSFPSSVAALAQAKQQIERLSDINSGLVDDFNTLLIAQSKGQRDALATRILTAESPEPAVGSIIRMVGGWRAPDVAAVAQHWSEEGWYVAGSTRLYDWPHLFVGWDTVILLHDTTTTKVSDE